MRDEKENLDEFNLPDPNQLSVNYILEGGDVLEDKDFSNYAQQVKEQNKKVEAICAKTTYNKHTKLSSYYILSAGGQMFDPTQIDIRYKRRNLWKFRRVNKSTFQKYHQFLKTKHVIFLRQAERSV